MVLKRPPSARNGRANAMAGQKDHTTTAAMPIATIRGARNIVAVEPPTVAKASADFGSSTGIPQAMRLCHCAVRAGEGGTCGDLVEILSMNSERETGD
jgi:hypothetical protein